METASNPFKDGVFALSTATLKDLIANAEDVVWPPNLAAEQLDDGATHINARVSPVAGRSWRVSVVGVFSTDGQTILGAVYLTIPEDKLGSVYDRPLKEKNEKD